jgi:hypothetical protein
VVNEVLIQHVRAAPEAQNGAALQAGIIRILAGDLQNLFSLTPC